MHDLGPVIAARKQESREGLARVLSLIEEKDTDYESRYVLVLRAMWFARRIDLAAGFRIDPAEPEWPVAYIELPTGQVSWHMPQHPIPWDGHDTATKYARCRAFSAEAA